MQCALTSCTTVNSAETDVPFLMPPNFQPRPFTKTLHVAPAADPAAAAASCKTCVCAIAKVYTPNYGGTGSLRCHTAGIMPLMSPAMGSALGQKSCVDAMPTCPKPDRLLDSSAVRGGRAPGCQPMMQLSERRANATSPGKPRISILVGSPGPAPDHPRGCCCCSCYAPANLHLLRLGGHATCSQ
jgi:hypothetical protein